MQRTRLTCSSEGGRQSEGSEDDRGTKPQWGHMPDVIRAPQVPAVRSMDPERRRARFMLGPPNLARYPFVRRPADALDNPIGCLKASRRSTDPPAHLYQISASQIINA